MCPWSRATLGALLAAVLLLAAAGAAFSGPGVAQTDRPRNGTDLAANTTMVVELQPDGDAEWTVSTEFDLETAEETEAFRALATEFETGQDPTLGLAAFERASELAAESTGREMAITDRERSVSSESEIENGTGRLVLEFTWENFARVDGERLHVDDVYRTEEGAWLSSLGPNQTLVIRPPPGYGTFDARIVPQNGTLRWDGPATFDEQSLQATFVGNAGNGSGDGTTPTEPTPGGETGAFPWIVAAIAVLGTGSVAAYLFVRSRDSDAPEEGAGGGAVAEGAAAPPPDRSEADDGDGEDEKGELLSDEERVKRLLEANGGRMKQADIVTETDWSNAKVSQLLSRMAEEGQIDKLRIGRENLISFPDQDLTDIDGRDG